MVSQTFGDTAPSLDIGNGNTDTHNMEDAEGRPRVNPRESTGRFGLTLICTIILTATLWAASYPPPVVGKEPNDSNSDDPAARAEAIMNRIDDLWRGTSSDAILTMDVQTENWQRTLKMEAWSLGKDYSLVRIKAPKKEAGTATLKVKDDIYNYLPKTDRTIKITSGMMMGSWMGSHFTNDDLVKESRYAEDYTAVLVFDGERNGKAVWDIRLDPKPDAPVVWGKVIFTVRQKDEMPISARYYDEDGSLVRTMTFSDYKSIGHRQVPMRLRLVPSDKPNEYTELLYESIRFDIGLKPSFFSLRNLKRQRSR